jgi:hypothetical protein
MARMGADATEVSLTLERTEDTEAAEETDFLTTD